MTRVPASFATNNLPARDTATLLLIRHAPLDDEGHLVGRRDLTLRVDPDAAEALRAMVGEVDHIAVSPAMRCRQTASALWPDRDAHQDAALWEQDFGAWEGAAYHHLPDLGEMTLETLALTAPPGGESFADACARIVPALEALVSLGGRIAVVAHAGTVRAALSRAKRSHAEALRHQIAPMSLTRIEVRRAKWSVVGIGEMPSDG